jgi:hypothetical protein
MTVTIASTDSAEDVKAAEAYTGRKAEPEDEPKKEPEKTSASADKVDETESASDADKKGDPDKESGDAKTSKADKRIDKLTKSNTTLEQERDYWKQAALEGKKPEPEKKDAKADVLKERPKADDFNSHDDYVEALAEWKADQRLDLKLKERDDAAKAEADKLEGQKVIETWKERQGDARKRYEDYDDVTDSDAPLTPTITEAILTSEVGADLAYWLGKNPDAAERLVKLTPIAQAREMGKIEAKIQSELEASKGEKKEDPEKGTGKREKPAPISPLKGDGKGKVALTTADADKPGMTQAEWTRLRLKEIKAKRG